MSSYKLEDRVILNEKTHTWHVKHIVDCFAVPGSDEFHKDYFEEIACLLGSKARRSKLRGVIKGFGAQDDDFKDKRPFVFVEFQWKGLKADFYCSEKDLRKP